MKKRFWNNEFLIEICALPWVQKPPKELQKTIKEFIERLGIDTEQVSMGAKYRPFRDTPRIKRKRWK